MRWVAGGVDCLFKPDFAGCNRSLAEKRLVHLEFVRLRPAPYDRLIPFGQFSFLHQGVEISGRRMRFCNEHESAGFAIQSSDDRNLASVRNFKCEQLSKLMPKGNGAIGFSRMD